MIVNIDLTREDDIGLLSAVVFFKNYVSLLKGLERHFLAALKVKPIFNIFSFEVDVLKELHLFGCLLNELQFFFEAIRGVSFKDGSCVLVRRREIL